MLDPTYIDREQFGLTLFDMIKELVKLDAIRAQMNHAVFHNESAKMIGLKKNYHDVHQEIASRLTKLTNDEMDQILTHYPFVVNL